MYAGNTNRIIIRKVTEERVSKLKSHLMTGLTLGKLKILNQLFHYSFFNFIAGCNANFPIETVKEKTGNHAIGGDKTCYTQDLANLKINTTVVGRDPRGAEFRVADLQNVPVPVENHWPG